MFKRGINPDREAGYGQEHRIRGGAGIWTSGRRHHFKLKRLGPSIIALVERSGTEVLASSLAHCVRDGELFRDNASGTLL